MNTTSITRWKAGDAITHGRLNEPIDALAGLATDRASRLDMAGQPRRKARIISVTATAVVDTNAEPAQWIPVIYECYKVKTGYGAPTARVWATLPEGEGYRGPGYYSSLMEIDGSTIPADIKLVAPIVGDLVDFHTVEVVNADGTLTIEAIIDTPLSAECA